MKNWLLDQVTILHMARQLSCQASAKLWTDWLIAKKLKEKIFQQDFSFELKTCL